MVRIYFFECDKCGYRANVAGGLTEGYKFAARTILCQECRELQDVVTRVKVPEMQRVNDPYESAPPFAMVCNRLPSTESGLTTWKEFEPACSVSRLHGVRDWNEPDKCPRCGVFLERSAIPFRHWD